MSNNKGKTWAARVRALNKDGWDENVESRVQAMTGDEWEALGMRVERAMDVLAAMLACGPGMKVMSSSDAEVVS